MDFEDTAEEKAFREEAASWLQANVPTEAELEGMDGMTRGKFWQKRKAEGGWACIKWPEEYGGRGASAYQGEGRRELGERPVTSPVLYGASGDNEGGLIHRRSSSLSNLTVKWTV